MVLEGPFAQMAVILAVATVVGMLALGLRQPLIVAFIAVGVLVGPAGFGWVAGPGSELELFASLGIAVLLFLVGLKLDPQLVRATGPVALTAGLGQMAFTSIVGYGIARLLGMEEIEAIYVALALTFSSTIIVVKLLSDKRELDDLHGRIAVGFLIVQDVAVILAMIVITALGTTDTSDLSAELSLVGLRGIAFLVVLFGLSRWALPALVGRVARNRELLLLFGVAWAIALAAVAESLGLSVEVGAFLAGISLASTPYREAIASRLVSLRDFLLFFFFIDLGAKLQLDLIGDRIGEAVILSMFVLVGKPLIVLVIMGAMRYRKRTAFGTGVALAQISEFSLILAALAVRVGHIGESTMGLVTLVGLITIGLSTYLILYSQPIFDRLAPYLSVFERKRLHPGEQHRGPHEGDIDVIVYGGGRHGVLIANGLEEHGRHVLVVDLDPDALETCRRHGLNVVYGDAEDPEFTLSLPLDQAKWVVSTVRGHDINMALLHGLRAAGYEGEVAVTAHDHADAKRFADEDVAVVVAPFAVAAERLVETLMASTSDRPDDEDA